MDWRQLCSRTMIGCARPGNGVHNLPPDARRHTVLGVTKFVTASSTAQQLVCPDPVKGGTIRKPQLSGDGKNLTCMIDFWKRRFGFSVHDSQHNCGMDCVFFSFQVITASEAQTGYLGWERAATHETWAFCI